VYEDYAVLDGVSVEIAGLNNDVKTTDPDYVKNTLTAANKTGDAVDIIIKDSSTGRSVPVNATLASLTISTTGKITAVLNGVHAPIESITNIKNAATEASSATKSSGTAGT
jgi:flagellar basal-body rod modification protein FlgD